MRVVFAGTPEFAATILRALLGSEHTIAAVYTQPDRPSGRGRRVGAGPVRRLADSVGLEVRQPATLREPETVEALRLLLPDTVVVAAYGLLLPPSVLAIPRFGCVNVHASLLPRWRGAAPVQRAILAGDTRTGVSIMAMDAGLDTGAVLSAVPCPIDPEDTSGTLLERLAGLGASALLAVLEGLPSGAVVPSPQDEVGVTHAPRVAKGEAEIDWSKPAVEIARQVRAFDPWPVAWTTLGPTGERRLRVWMARALDSRFDAPAGTVVSAATDAIDVATGEGTLRLLEVQPAGARRMTAAAFLNSGAVSAGAVLGASPG